MTILNKYVLEKWVSENGHEETYLRFINREGKRFFFSDVARTNINYDIREGAYGFRKNWARRFAKDDKTIFRRSIGFLSNTDGTIEYEVHNDPSTCKCKYSFDEIFNLDLRNVQDPNDEPRCRKEIIAKEFALEGEPLILKLRPEFIDGKSVIIKDNFFGNYYDTIDERNVQLSKLFKVNNIYRVDEISEHYKQTVITKSATFFHFNQNLLNKKVLTRDENSINLTILFWLFDDKLIYCHQLGKNSW